MKVWDIQYIHLKQISSSQIKLKRRTLLGGEKGHVWGERKNKKEHVWGEKERERKKEVSEEKKSKKNLRASPRSSYLLLVSVQAYICLITLPCQDLSINAFQASSLLWSLIQGLVRLILHIDMISRLKNQSIFTRNRGQSECFSKLKVFGAQRTFATPILTSLQEAVQRRDNDWFVRFRCGFPKTLPFLWNFPVGKHLCTSCGIS